MTILKYDSAVAKLGMSSVLLVGAKNLP